MDWPIKRAKSAVPRPTRPPRAKPALKTTASIPMRTRPTRTPERRWMPVIQPSRGPGPRPVLMYKAEAIPTRMMPVNANASPGRNWCCCGKVSTPICRAAGMTRKLRKVPKPGRSRKGIHSRSTTQLMAQVAHPKLIPVRLEIPSDRTIQGELPNRDWTNKDSPMPKRNREAVRMRTRNGARSQRVLPRQGVNGMVRCGLKISIRRLKKPRSIEGGYSIDRVGRRMLGPRIALPTQ